MAVTPTYTPVSTYGKNGTSFSGESLKTVGGNIASAKAELNAFKEKTDLTEVDMIDYNMAASKYSTMVSLASGLIKNLTDTEKQVANKM